ncbi:MAG: HlyD family secretion protein [Tannerella sp.]|jgi:hypothetical protein|nr:HlyD family secretion protein [Tannerella sp.]
MEKEKDSLGKEIETNADIELHQRDIGDLLGDAPEWLIHSGSYSLYSMLLLFILLSSLIRYPDVVRGSVSIEDVANVEWITVNYTGLIDTIFVKNDSILQVGDTIGLIQNPADLDDIRHFAGILTNVERYYLTNNTELIRKFPFNLSMGEMTDAYENFTAAVRSCLIYDDHNYVVQRSNFLQQEITILKREPEKNALAILQTERDLFELSVSHQLEQHKNRKQLEVAYEDMINSIQIWESKYLIRSHRQGRIVLGEVRALTRVVNMGDTIGTVISNNKPEFVARMNVTQEQIGGIEAGYPVEIRLFKYPERTYGRLIGMVNTLTFTPLNKQYNVDITLPNQLRTTANKELYHELGLKGDAEIISSNKSVLSRVFGPIISLWKRKDIKQATI